MTSCHTLLYYCYFSYHGIYECKYKSIITLMLKSTRSSPKPNKSTEDINIPAPDNPGQLIYTSRETINPQFVFHDTAPGIYVEVKIEKEKKKKEKEKIITPIR